MVEKEQKGFWKRYWKYILAIAMFLSLLMSIDALSTGRLDAFIGAFFGVFISSFLFISLSLYGYYIFKKWKMKEVYTCDYCTSEFSSKEECKKHEDECKKGKKKKVRLTYFCSKCKTKVMEEDVTCPKCKNLLARDGAIIRKEE